ncbi:MULTISPECIES: glycoside hydrolase family 73 protein [Aerococcus]|uniref:N-acetylmuramoyl-L-alanine amidase n=1 Tax=Aerococcus sanguinicola TaxID=119206 RepID=A0A5N1GN72_9LACT|nr:MULTISPECIES: glycoside hydrolase family 73 protein [Aerococcus]KAA9302242.1 N-acetylmuramoyl-L-alanine amidase [Aerococcus sanguinicola]MDK6368993.1 glycoside hydrolase family 73 protein [Aerococcus sp. UMB9870]MDK6678896.1 glycoside hydrolase family 73 protein [Aerococcus sp. UMB8608]MDK6686786.1 glycoside hydrolase family 73 protein [Aerococcus sp. UMB8623]MDK6939554.1 glycoside hydrolase family 73 protein [Aerococcus sp. UMB8487]
MAKLKKARSRRRSKRSWGQKLLLGLLFIFALGLLVWPSFRLERHEEDQTAEEFLDEIGQYAMANAKNSGVLPSLVVAQAAIESDFGRSQLARDYNNLFGRKAYGGERSVDLPTQEYTESGYQTVEAPFKVYPSWRAAVVDHGRLMQEGTDWNPDLYLAVRQAEDPKTAAYALQAAGYATDPHYAEKLIEIIQTYGLDKYDKMDRNTIF